MGEDDGAGARFPHDAARHHSGTRSFPVERIHVPKDGAIAKLTVDPLLLPCRDRTVRRSHQDRVSPDRRLDRVVGLLQLCPHTVIPHFFEGGVRPAVVADFMTLAHRPLKDLGMINHVLAEHKKRRVDVVGGEDVEQLRSQLCARAIVEGHRNEGPVDMHGAIADGGRSRGGRNRGCRRSCSKRRHGFRGKHTGQAEEKQAERWRRNGTGK